MTYICWFDRHGKVTKLIITHVPYEEYVLGHPNQEARGKELEQMSGQAVAATGGHADPQHPRRHFAAYTQWNAGVIYVTPFHSEIIDIRWTLDDLRRRMFEEVRP